MNKNTSFLGVFFAVRNSQIQWYKAFKALGKTCVVDSMENSVNLTLLILHLISTGGVCMYENYLSIGQELALIKEELQDRLVRYATEQSGYIDEKERYVIEMIKADLKDVEHALAKLDVGAFGIDELTGEVMSIHKLKVMPTARTNEDLFVLW